MRAIAILMLVLASGCASAKGWTVTEKFNVTDKPTTSSSKDLSYTLGLEASYKF